MSDAKKKRTGVITLKNVRLSYPHIFKPGKEMRGSDGKMQPGKYGLTAIIDSSTPDGKRNLAAWKKAKEEVMGEKWGDNVKLAADKLAMRKYSPPVDEEGEVDEEAIKEEYVGMHLLSARNSDKPKIIDNIKVEIGGKRVWRPIEEGEGKPYGGCYGNVVVRLWAQDKPADEGGKRVNASLEIVQFYAHGESFGAGPIDAEDYIDDDMVEGADIDGGIGDDEEGGNTGVEEDDLV